MDVDTLLLKGRVHTLYCHAFSSCSGLVTADHTVEVEEETEQHNSKYDNEETATGIAEVTLGSGGSLSYVNSKDLGILSKTLGPFPVAFFAVLIAAAIFIVVLSTSTFGRKLYAIGSNRTAAKYAGIKVSKIRLIVYGLAGFMAGMCALFILTTTFGANTTTGQNYEMDVIAMCVFGGIATTGGKGNLFGALIAGFSIVCLRIALGLINTNPQLILIIIGLLLIISVLISGISQMRGKKLKKKKA